MKQRKKGEKDVCHVKKKLCISSAQFVAYTSGLSGVFSSFLSLRPPPLIFRPNLSYSHNSPRIFAQIGPCPDIRVASPCDIWRVPERPVFPTRSLEASLGMFLLTDRADTSPSYLWCVYDLTLLREIFSFASPFTFPLLRRTIGYDCGFACILTRDLYALRSYWDRLSDEIPVYFFNIVTNKAGIPCI